MKKGFTLLELLIVIGILAILATAATVVLNPAQLLAQARDSQRIGDLGAIKSALSLYLTDYSAPDLDGSAALSCTTMCFTQTTGVTANCGARHGTKATTIDADRTIDSLGWIPVDFEDISGGSPLPVLPIDPSNSATYFYSYACNSSALTFELNANLESTKYALKEANTSDGGNLDTIYEIGTALSL